MDNTTETVGQRIERLQLTNINAGRLATLTIAHELVDDTTFAKISDALRVSKSSTVTLPRHPLENKSRGRGWARQGHGDLVVWGERVDDGYRVGTGRWSVGATDGYRRKGSDDWTVEHVTVGDQVWTLAR